MELVIGGTYQHFKNKKLYKVIGIAKHSETLEDMVVYEPQYKNETLGETAQFWVRPLSMFIEEVLHEGRKQPRFSLVED
jgi:hypothetical protein